MCHQCNYEALLTEAKLDPTENRRRVLEVIGNNRFPLSAGDIYQTVERTGSINRVTVYRILDLLLDHGLVERISTGGRAFCYGMAPNENHRPHPHFYCKRCGRMDCLSPESLTIDIDALLQTFPGRIDKVEVRVDGVCKDCLK
ncbi:transcriptional repressor [uncultured Desulfosarcina sp.]|uniref:Fur family transcriptional regulator n=1 Tax=uncultured Desulfosarcina sp. TaxID=218289 RepID=UPI0029C7A948|nr:transcriptional repressor [uncultured Desulfosarcina sp.]